MNSKLAEFIGAMIGDGCLSIINSHTKKRIRKIALLTGHLKHDIDYYVNVIRPIIRGEFGTFGYLQKRPKRNCIYLVMGGLVFYFLKEIGLPIGKKIQIQIPRIILQNKEFSKACVRGIFDTDGSIYRRYSKQYKNHPRFYNYLVIQFKLNSKKVIEQIKQILDRYGILSNRIIQETNAYVLRVTNQKEVKRFIEIIKPSNKYHLERYINR